MSDFLFIKNHKDINVSESASRKNPNEEKAKKPTISPFGSEVDFELENKAKDFSAGYNYSTSLWNLKKFVSDGNSKLSSTGQKTSIFLNNEM